MVIDWLSVSDLPQASTILACLGKLCRIETAGYFVLIVVVHDRSNLLAILRVGITLVMVEQGDWISSENVVVLIMLLQQILCHRRLHNLLEVFH